MNTFCLNTSVDNILQYRLTYLQILIESNNVITLSINTSMGYVATCGWMSRGECHRHISLYYNTFSELTM